MNRLTVATILAAVSLAFAAPAFADHHEEQDGCDHGATSKPCRPDPQPTNGKDCDVHGNHGGVNEDHCAPTPTTTPTEVPSSPTTATSSPTVAPTTAVPSTTSPTSQPTSPSPTSSTPKPPETARPSSPSTTPPTAESSPPTTGSKPPSSPSQPSPRRSVPSSTVAPPEQLARTGFTATLALLGAGLLAAGVALNRKGAHR